MKSKIATLFLVTCMCILALSSCKKDENPDVPSGPTITDIDGNVYHTVKIGNQTWTVENLKTTHYRNGDPIPENPDNWSWLTTDAYCNILDDDSYTETYGRLYNWYAVNDPRGLAPEGWHIPSDAEWKELEMYLGMTLETADQTGKRGTLEGNKLKAEGNDHWTGNNAGTNETGFYALPTSGRSYGGAWNSAPGPDAFFWTSTTDADPARAWLRQLISADGSIGRYNYSKTYGFGVRCVKD